MTPGREREQILALQRRRLTALVEHCQRFSPNFRDRLARCPEGALPLLTRRILQSEPDIHCTKVPASHGRVGEIRTSGSTGEPVTVCKTERGGAIWTAMTMRFHEWHRTDFSQTLMTVKASFESVERRDDWGEPVSRFHRTGPAIGVPAATEAADLFRLAHEYDAGDLLIFPNNLEALIAFCQRTGRTLPNLRRVRTVSETLQPGLAAACRTVLGHDPIDMYSSNELGIIAFRCPDSPLYHTMDDALVVEVLRPDGSACSPGEAGELVITDLFNYATPLVRYALGDHAVAGGDCPCGRPLGTLERILGRSRNLILLPDGRQVWPALGLFDARTIAPVIQHQVIQHDPGRLELRLHCERSLVAGEEAGLRALVNGALGHDFRIDVVYFDQRLPKGANGKFEEFVRLC